MHRFEAVQQLVRDGRPAYYPPTNQYSVPSSFVSPLVRGGNMFYSHPSNKVYPPGSNQRLANMLSSGPAAFASPPTNIADSTGPYYNRFGIPSQGPPQSYHNNGGMMDPMGGDISQKMRAAHYMPTSYGRGTFPPGAPASSFGYSNVPGANRYHPYHQAYPYQQQQQRAGFLEQLLKNRGAQQSSGYAPYGRLPADTGMMMGVPPSLGNQQPYHQGYRGMNLNQGNVPAPFGGSTGRMGGSHFGSPSHLQYQNYPPWRNGGVTGSGGSGYQYRQNSQHQPQNPFQHHQAQNPRSSQFLPVIKNEPEDDGQGAEGKEKDCKEGNDPEIGKSEMRYRKNHERMNAILDEKMANCDPIKVPMERVKSLRHHVRLLTDDLDKHKQDALLIKEVCSKRLQDFKESTARFHSDYKKLCQPIAEEEYNELVDKYYKELKEKLKDRNENSGVDGGVVASTDAVIEGMGDMRLAGESKETVFIKTEKQSAPPSPSCSNGGGEASSQHLGVGNFRMDEAAAQQDDEYFEHPLFIDIPPEENEHLRSGLPVSSQQQQQEQQNHQMYQQSQYHTSIFPSPPIMQPGETGSDLYFGGHQLPQQHVDYSYYPSTSLASGFAGNGMGNLLMPVQTPPPPPPPPLQQGPFLRGQNSYPNQQYPPRTFHSYHQQSSVRTQYHHHQFPPPQFVAPQTKRPRPSEELRDFLLGLVRSRYQEEGVSGTIHSQHQHLQQVPQLEQQHGGLPPTSTDPPPESQDSSQLQPRRFMMSGGGIVEVKNSPPQAPSQEQLYDDSATRDWINSLTTDAASVEVNLMPSADEGDGETSQDDNSNLQMDLDTAGMEDNTSPGTNLASGTTSKIAELLESPCLNDNIVEEFESDLRQLEDALHGNPEETTSSLNEEVDDSNQNDMSEEKDDELQ